MPWLADQPPQPGQDFGKPPSIGRGGGLLAKTGRLETDNEAYRQTIQQVPLYSRALASGLPFPKTRRIVFLNNQPATLPGWAVLEVE